MCPYQPSDYSVPAGLGCMYVLGLGVCLSRGTFSCSALRCLHYYKEAQDICRLCSTCLHVRPSCEARLGAVGSG